MQYYECETHVILWPGPYLLDFLRLALQVAVLVVIQLLLALGSGYRGPPSRRLLVVVALRRRRRRVGHCQVREETRGTHLRGLKTSNGSPSAVDSLRHLASPEFGSLLPGHGYLLLLLAVVIF